MHVVATAGHVDHGKSTLIKALTGTDPDRLEEEKARGLTIDLGFAGTKLPSGRGISFIDVPGHVHFLKNMLAGVGGVECADEQRVDRGAHPRPEAVPERVHAMTGRESSRDRHQRTLSEWTTRAIRSMLRSSDPATAFAQQDGVIKDRIRNELGQHRRATLRVH